MSKNNCMNPMNLIKKSIIGAAVIPSKQDPTLENGVAIVTLEQWDHQ